MLRARLVGALGLVLLAASACAPETGMTVSRPSTPPAAIGGNGTSAPAGTGGAPLPTAASGGAGAAGAPGLIIKPAPAPSAGSPAAGSGGAGAECGTIRQQAEATPGAVDIVWVIDGSGSMGDEQAAVQKNIASFADAIGGAGLDHHVVMARRPMWLPGRRSPRTRRITSTCRRTWARTTRCRS